MLTSPARALLQGCPSRPLRLVVPAAEGSTFGILACALTTQLRQQVGREMGVGDRPATNDMATGEAVAHTLSDNHMLLLQ